MARKFQRHAGGVESPLYKTESGFITGGADLIEAGRPVMYKSASPATDIHDPAPIVLSDGTSCIGLLNQDIVPSRAASTLGYTVGAKQDPNWRRIITHEAEEGDVCAVVIGPAYCSIASECLAATPAAGNLLYATNAGKLTPTLGTPAAAAGNLAVAVCESSPDSDGNVRILLLGPFATYYSYFG